VRPLGAEGVIVDCGRRAPADEHQRRTQSRCCPGTDGQAAAAQQSAAKKFSSCDVACHVTLAVGGHSGRMIPPLPTCGQWTRTDRQVVLMLPKTRKVGRCAGGLRLQLEMADFGGGAIFTSHCVFRATQP
jgi:hypothetical protein